MADDLFDAWAAGTTLADNTYFEEIPGELDHPADFAVTPEQIPDNPVNPVTPPEPISTHEPVEESDNGPEVTELPGLGKVQIEKTTKGWKATVDFVDTAITSQNFYGNNWRALAVNLAKSVINGSIVIKKLKKEKMLGGEEPQHVPAAQRNIPKTSTLTADEVYEIKNKLADNPSEGLDAWVKKRFGLDPDEFAEALKSAPEAKRIVEAQKIAAEVKEVNDDFIRNNPDYVETYQSDENARSLIQRMAKVYLKKSISKSLKVPVDDVIFELFSKGFWTEENLETAKNELIESGLLEPTTSVITVPKQNNQPVANSPTEPAKRIAPSPGQPAGLGLPARNSSPAVIPEEKSLSVTDLYNMPLDKLKEIGLAQLRAQNR